MCGMYDGSTRLCTDCGHMYSSAAMLELELAVYTVKTDLCRKDRKKRHVVMKDRNGLHRNCCNAQD